MKTTTGGEDFSARNNSQFRLNADTIASISIPIINNDVFELTESFMVKLSFPDLEARVTLDQVQTSASVTIFDDDGNQFSQWCHMQHFNAYLLYAVLNFELDTTAKVVNESDSLSLDIFRTGQFSGNYRPSIIVSTSGSARGTTCCLLYTSPSPRDATLSRMPSSA